MHILCIDDELDMLNVMRVILTRFGHEVHAVPDGGDGITILQAGFLPDVVVVNCLMPRVPGIEVVRYLAKHHRFKHVGLVFHSALAERALPTKDAAWPRVDVLLAVPFQPQELVLAVESAYNRRRRA